MSNQRVALGIEMQQPTDVSGLVAALQQNRQASANATQQEFQNERQTGIDEQTSELREAQIAKQEIDNMDARQQSRLKNSVIGAAQLDGFLQSGNVEGARSYLQRRRQELGQKIAAGEEVDTIETDDAIRMLDEDIEGLKGITSKSLEFGKLTGILKRPGGDRGLPADVVFADELGKARNEGDTQRVKDLLLAKKSLEKGQTVDAQGNIISAPGALKSKEDLSGATEAGKQKAKLKLEPSVVRAKEIAKKVGGAEGVTLVELNERVAGFPRLQEIAVELSNLGKVATFTKKGQLVDATRRELGFNVGLGAIARKEYISKVANEILPLLRQTFGAAFTKEEGDSLKATLGDPDASPEEKDAVLKSFIATKAAQIETLKRQAPQDGISIVEEPKGGGVADLSDAELERIANGQ